MLKIIAFVLLMAWLPSGCIAAREQTSEQETRSRSSFCWPLTTFRYSRSVSSGGWLAPRGRGARHLGVDMFAPVGTPVRAIADGLVYDISYGGWGSGNVAIMVKHTLADGRWFIALYGHIRNTRGLHKGSHVQACTIIGVIGNYRYGSHLHFGVIRPNTAPHAPYGTSKRADHNHFIDPLQFLRNSRPSPSDPGTIMLQGPLAGEKTTEQTSSEVTTSLHSSNKKRTAKKVAQKSRSTKKKVVKKSRSRRSKKKVFKKKTTKRRVTGKVRSLTKGSKRAVSPRKRR
jgi:hypothetical protein